MEKDFYSTIEVAEMYNLKEVSVRSYINRGQLKATKFNNHSWLITKENLEEWEKTRHPRRKKENKK